MKKDLLRSLSQEVVIETFRHIGGGEEDLHAIGGEDTGEGSCPRGVEEHLRGGFQHPGLAVVVLFQEGLQVVAESESEEDHDLGMAEFGPMLEEPSGFLLGRSAAVHHTARE